MVLTRDVIEAIPRETRAPVSVSPGGLDETGAVGNFSPGLTGTVALELAKAVEQLPGEHGMPGGSRFELKWDGFLH